MSPARGVSLAPAAAAAFGSSAPLIKRFFADAPPLALSGMLYPGAGGALWIAERVRPRASEAPLSEPPKIPGK